MIKEGDKIEDFKISSDCRGEFNLSNFKGKNLVIYFYPKDNTPGCTLEAKDFSGLYDKFAQQNCEVIGISKDNIESHKKFKKLFNLGHILATPNEEGLLQSFGVLQEKSMFGKKYLGIDRSTFLVDTKGVVKKVWRKVKIFGHAQEVLNELEKINYQ
jgi:peroxiredoxin Q/BCP